MSETVITDPEQALTKLLDGNARFVEERREHPNQCAGRRQQILAGQQPFAVILACSDSRVAPEIIFDQGLGDLFVIRVAGNVSDDIVLASIEYAAGHLGSPLVMVLGHACCGAVTAAVQGGEAEGSLPYLLQEIAPAVERARQDAGDLVDASIRSNAELVAEKISSDSPVLARLIDAGSLKVVAGYYHFETGKVDVL